MGFKMGFVMRLRSMDARLWALTGVEPSTI